MLVTGLRAMSVMDVNLSGKMGNLYLQAVMVHQKILRLLRQHLPDGTWKKDLWVGRITFVVGFQRMILNLYLQTWSQMEMHLSVLIPGVAPLLR